MASRRDLTGTLMGLAVFLGGVALLGLTFKLAFDQFGASHAKALGLEKGKELNLNATGGAAADIVIQLGVLLIMAIVGSMIANKGIGLYAGCLHPIEKHPEPLRHREEALRPEA